MKHFYITFLSFLTSTFVFAQEVENKDITDFNKWSVEIAGGIHKPTRTFATGYYASTPSLGQGSIGVRYMTNEKFGLKLDFGYASIQNADESLEFQTTNYRASLQGVINAGSLLKFNNWTNRIGLLVHAGGGYSANAYDEDFVGSDAASDNMLHIMGGITPQLKLSNRVMLFGDVTAIGNTRQYRTWDGTQLSGERGVNGFIINTSLGLSISLGSKDEHVDWYSENEALENKVSELEQRINELESDLTDSDKDGVPDYLDRELNTTSGVAVDTKGYAIDRNENGIPDELEPNLDNRFLLKKDYKPAISTGSIIKDLIENGYVNVYFKFNSTETQNTSNEALNFIKTYMNDNPSAKADLVGYADEIGDPEYNSTLSERRAKKVFDILVASGISADRLTHSGGGEDTSVDKSSEEARNLVRRVTFRLK